MVVWFRLAAPGIAHSSQHKFLVSATIPLINGFALLVTFEALVGQ